MSDPHGGPGGRGPSTRRPGTGSHDDLFDRFFGVEPGPNGTNGANGVPGPNGSRVNTDRALPPSGPAGPDGDGQPDPVTDPRPTRSSVAVLRSGRHRAHRAGSMLRTSVLTLAGAIFPGWGYVMAGRVRLGVATLVAAITFVVAVVVIGITQHHALINAAVDPSKLTVLAVLVVIVGLVWITIIVTQHRMLRPAASGVGRRIAGSAFVGLLCFAISAPTATAAFDLMAQRSLITKVFVPEQDQSAGDRSNVVLNTAPPTKGSSRTVDPWAKTPRINILLIGADSGAGRTGTRTDSIEVASIDTHTGNTTLISIPRNVEGMPFPKGTKLHDTYPDGFFKAGLDPRGSAAEEYMTDAMYDNIPQQHPEDIPAGTTNPGAYVLGQSVSAALGIPINYYMQINLQGFVKVIDALGGITVNINYKVPVGGDYATNTPPSRYLDPGPNKHLMGVDALWFARGRYGVQGGDNARQARQHCAIAAIVKKANPTTVVANYQSIASASQSLLRTNIPSDQLPAFVTLAERVKTGKITSLPPGNDTYFRYDHPDFELAAKTVREAIAPHAVAKASPSPTTSKSPKASASSTGSASNAQNVTDACAYHPTS